MAAQNDDRIELLRSSLKLCHNFPKPGIHFIDVFEIFANPKVHQILIDLVIERVRQYDESIDAIIALEARGFIFGPQVALALQVPFIPIRKHGKLPGNISAIDYELTYGKDTINIQLNILQPDSKVIILDDLLATGGTLRAAEQICIQNGYKMVRSLVIIELIDRNGRNQLQNPDQLSALIQLTNDDLATIHVESNHQTNSSDR